TFYHQMDYGKHICMVFDLMAGSLYDIMKVGKYTKGFPLNIVKIIVHQLLIAINILNTRYRLVHTDLKTENILVTSINRKTKEIIDKFSLDKRLMNLLNNYNKNKGKFDNEIKSIMVNMKFDDIEEKYHNPHNKLEIIDDLI